LFRYRINYTKDGPARYISHLDLVRTVERTLRRSSLPVAFSEGFNPHPKFSFVLPLPVGVAGLDEYMDLELTRELDPGELSRLLNENLPRGLKVRGAKPVPAQGKSLMAMVERAAYRVVGAPREPITQQVVEQTLQEFMNREALVVHRRGKKDGDLRPVDIRAGILSLAGSLDETGNLVLTMELKAGSTGNVRPEEVLRALLELTGLPLSEYGLDIYRTELYGF
jgi:radical SAM-linked protein